MNAHTVQRAGTRVSAGTWSAPVPSSFVEFGFYAYMFYTLLGGLFGITGGNVAPAILVGLVIFCLRDLGFLKIHVFRVVAFPLGCAISYMFIQFVFFDDLLVARPFLIWMLLLFLIQSLVLRENFIRRFILVMFVIGLIALPYISFRDSATSGGMMARAGLDKAIGFGGVNAMGEWYGFCALGFVVQAVTTRKNTLRILYSLIAVGCLYVVTLTVSRGAVLAVAVGGVVAGRHLLKDGFFPTLLVLGIGWGIMEMGVFERSVQSYSARGTEETGRLAVWPRIIDSFLGSPLIGVGHENTGAVPDGRHKMVKAHNSFLFLAQSSGIVPLALFIAYWLRSGRAALRGGDGKSLDAPFCAPLLIYTFVTVNLSGLTFMQVWAIVSLAIPMAVEVRRALSEGTGRRYVRDGESFLQSGPHARMGIQGEDSRIP